jgi:hypothetical protein
VGSIAIVMAIGGWRTTVQLSFILALRQPWAFTFDGDHDVKVDHLVDGGILYPGGSTDGALATASTLLGDCTGIIYALSGIVRSLNVMSDLAEQTVLDLRVSAKKKKTRVWAKALFQLKGLGIFDFSGERKITFIVHTVDPVPGPDDPFFRNITEPPKREPV